MVAVVQRESGGEESARHHEEPITVADVLNSRDDRLIRSASCNAASSPMAGRLLILPADRARDFRPSRFILGQAERGNTDGQPDADL